MIPSNAARVRLAALLIAALITGGCGQRGPDVEKLLADARQEREKGNHAAAIVHLKNVIQSAPDNAEARYQLGLAYSDTNDFPSAEKELRRALELRYDPQKVTVPLGKALLAIGEHQKLLDQVKVEGATGAKAQADVLALRGAAMIALRREKEGRAAFEEALGKQPDLAEALLGLARLAAVEKKFEEAGKLVERTIASSPRNVDAWIMKGDLNRVLRRGDPAADYLKAIEISPENVPARLNLVTMRISANEFDEAQKLLAEARKLAPRNPLVKYWEALLEYRKKNYAAAREGVLQVLKVAPNHMPTVLLAGAVEYTLGSHVQAQSYLSRVIERSPGNLYARRMLVSSLAKTGQTQRAQEVLAPALAAAPQDASLLSIAGEIAMQANDVAKAQEYFDKAAKIDPKSAGARTGLAVSRLAGGDADSGVADLEAAVELDTQRYHADVLLVASHLQRARYDQALKAVQSLEKKQPNNPLTYNLKAAALIGKKDIKGARRELERALELQPTYLPAAINLAQLDLQEKNPQAARQRLESVADKSKDNMQALLTLAEFGPRLGATPQEQVAWLERAGRANPGTVQPKLMLARYYVKTGDPKKALTIVQQAAAANPDSMEVLEALGSIQMAAGEKNQALTTYRKLATVQPKSPVAHYRLASALAANADMPGAAASLRKALELKPDYLEAQAALVDLEIRGKRYGEALAVARQTQKQSPKSPLGHMLEGDVMMADKKYPQAVKPYETAFGIAASGQLAIKIHAALTFSGRADEANARLAQWIKTRPNDPAARYYAADVALKAGKYKAAIEQYEWLQQNQPDNIVVLNNLAWAYQQVKDERALATAERAYKLMPDNPAIGDTLGWLLVEQGDVSRGLPLLQKAVTAAPKAPGIRYHLAQAWLKSGDKGKARTELERLIVGGEEFPERSDAMALLKQLRN